MCRNKGPCPNQRRRQNLAPQSSETTQPRKHIKYIPRTDWPSGTHSRVRRVHWDVYFRRCLPSQMPKQECTTRGAVGAVSSGLTLVLSPGIPFWPPSLNLNKTCFPSHSDWLLNSFPGNQEPAGGGVLRGPTSDPPAPPRDSRVAGSAVLRSESRSTAEAEAGSYGTVQEGDNGFRPDRHLVCSANLHYSRLTCWLSRLSHHPLKTLQMTVKIFPRCKK